MPQFVPAPIVIKSNTHLDRDSTQSSSAADYKSAIGSFSNNPQSTPSVQSPTVTDIVTATIPSQALPQRRKSLLAPLSQRKSPGSDAFENYLVRHKEIADVTRQIWLSNFESALEIICRESRDRILPRYTILVLHIRLSHFLISGTQSDRRALLESTSSIISVCNAMLATDPISIAGSSALSSFPRAPSSFPKQQTTSSPTIASISLSSQEATRMPSPPIRSTPLSPRLSLIRPRSQTPPQHQETEWQPENHESLFWWLWKEEAHVCLAQSLLMRGLLQICEGREIKGALDLRKSWQIFSKISNSLDSLSSSSVSSTPANTLSQAVQTLRDDLSNTTSLYLSIYNLSTFFLPESLLAFLRAVGLRSDKINDAQHTLFTISFQPISIAPFSSAALLTCAAAVPPAFVLLASPIISSTQIDQIVQEIRRKWPRSIILSLLAARASMHIGELQRAYNILNAIPPANISQSALGLRTSDLSSSLPVASANWTRVELAISALLLQHWPHALSLFSHIWKSTRHASPHSSPTLNHSQSTTTDPPEYRPLVGLFLAGMISIAPLLGLLSSTNSTLGLSVSEILKECQHDISRITESHQRPTLKRNSTLRTCSAIVEWSLADPQSHMYMLMVLMYLRRDMARIGLSSGAFERSEALCQLLQTIQTQLKHADNAHELIAHLISGTLAKYKFLDQAGNTSPSLNLSHSQTTSVMWPPKKDSDDLDEHLDTLDDKAKMHLQACINLDPSMSGTSHSNTLMRRLMTCAYIELAEVEGACFGRWRRARAILLDVLRYGRAQPSTLSLSDNDSDHDPDTENETAAKGDDKMEMSVSSSTSSMSMLSLPRPGSPSMAHPHGPSRPSAKASASSQSLQKTSLLRRTSAAVAAATAAVAAATAAASTTRITDSAIHDAVADDQHASMYSNLEESGTSSMLSGDRGATNEPEMLSEEVDGKSTKHRAGVLDDDERRLCRAALAQLDRMRSPESSI